MITKKEIFSILHKGDYNSFLGNGILGTVNSLLLIIMDFFSKKLTVKEAKEYVKEISGGKVQYRESKSSSEAYIVVSKSGNHIIYTGSSARNRITLAHELGHYISETKIRSYNKKKLENNLNKKGHTPKEIVGAELEAWKEAEKLLPKSLELKLQKKLALNTYKHSMAIHIKLNTEDEESIVVYRKRTLMRLLIPTITGVISSVIMKNNKKVSTVQKSRITLISVALGSLIAHYFIKRLT